MRRFPRMRTLGISPLSSSLYTVRTPTDSMRAHSLTVTSSGSVVVTVT